MCTPNRLLALVFVVFGLASYGWADVQKSHSGNTSPVTEGWTEYVGSNCTVGPLSDDMGHDAWFTNDAGANYKEFSNYSFDLSTADLASLHVTGWKMSAQARVPAPSTPNTTVAFWFVDSDTRFAINLWRDADQQNWVSLGDSSYDWSLGPTFAVNDGYRLYELVSNGTTASFYIDGLLKATGYDGDNYTQLRNYVAFGSGTSAGTGQGNWAMVRFTQLPEPSGLMLTLMLGGTVLSSCRRRRQ